MAETNPLKDPWLVAVWPGMGNVAVGAGAYLIAKLGAALVHELPPAGVFDLNHIDVKEGIARAGRLPRSMFFEWRMRHADGSWRDVEGVATNIALLRRIAAHPEFIANRLDTRWLESVFLPQYREPKEA